MMYVCFFLRSSQYVLASMEEVKIKKFRIANPSYFSTVTCVPAIFSGNTKSPAIGISGFSEVGTMVCLVSETRSSIPSEVRLLYLVFDILRLPPNRNRSL